ncbi:electron transport complex subunit RsxG [Pseudidiomarina aestuarii]|uniref:Ion-translocating oxidoreductase complex subunit G n=1 Tax=Pseudidiomarina aestuarii TaxID=624146 RepID=A0A2T4D3L5_9GAMM|nr:electron transport complex subunit RsxG [Pseudidiomarina aestuarii]
MIARSMRRNGLILAVFAMLATLLIVVIAKLTEAPIQRQQEAELLRVLNEIIPARSHDNDLYASCTQLNVPELGSKPQRAYRAWLNGEPQALAITVTAPDGYSGAIQLMVAIQYDGSVAGVRTLAHAETPGLGDKIERRKSDWIDSFQGLTVNGSDDPRWAVKRDGGIFDQFTGATITPRAVVSAVEKAVLSFQANRDSWFAAPSNCWETTS